MVRRLSEERVRELAEDIWTASTGRVVPARPIPDPRSSRPGASAEAAYRRRRQQEREAWRPGWPRRAGIVAGAASGAGLLTGLAVGAWLGWQLALLVALLTGWRLRFRPSAGTRVWRRQAVVQRRTAGALGPLEQAGYLVLHDITLPGWPAGLDHLVVGPTGIWVLGSWQRGRLVLLRNGSSPWPACGATAGPLRGLHWQAAAIADTLAAGTSIPVRPLLCVHGGARPGSARSVEGLRVAEPAFSPSERDRCPWPRPPGATHGPRRAHAQAGGFPHAEQVLVADRHVTDLAGGSGSTEVAYAVTSLDSTQADAARLGGLLRASGRSRTGCTGSVTWCSPRITAGCGPQAARR